MRKWQKRNAQSKKALLTIEAEISHALTEHENKITTVNEFAFGLRATLLRLKVQINNIREK